MTSGVRSIPYARNWPCRRCGSGVGELDDTCQFCGYSRTLCLCCGGTGVKDSGPHPVGIPEEPCGCEDGYEYPETERVRI